jgi:hypothetical protein
LAGKKQREERNRLRKTGWSFEKDSFHLCRMMCANPSNLCRLIERKLKSEDRKKVKKTRKKKFKKWAKKKNCSRKCFASEMEFLIREILPPTYIHTYTHTRVYIHTYTHTHMYTYIGTLADSISRSFHSSVSRQKWCHRPRSCVTYYACSSEKCR